MLIKTIEEWKEQLQNSNKLIVVEGKKDKFALNSLNIKNIFVSVIDNFPGRYHMILANYAGERLAPGARIGFYGGKIL